MTFKADLFFKFWPGLHFFVSNFNAQYKFAHHLSEVVIFELFSLEGKHSNYG